MRRVLIVAYFFPPLANSGTQRSLKFAHYLPNFGWEPLVLTVDHPPDQSKDEALLTSLPEDLQILRAPMLSDVLATKLSCLAPEKLRRRLADGLGWRLRRRYSSPDIYALWRSPAVNAAIKAYREAPFDAIFATGYPWTSLLVGRDVARKTGRPFIADFRDPWTGEDIFDDSGARQKRRQRRLEQEVLRDAAAVTILEDLLTGGVLPVRCEAERAKVKLIPNGYDPEDFANCVPFSPKPLGKVRIVYSGVWRKGYGPEALYRSVSELAKAAPELAGKFDIVTAGYPPGEAERQGLRSYITELGALPHSRALGLMCSADFLFLSTAPGRRLDYHFPGKAYEYLASGRPVLALTLASSCLAAFLQQTGNALVVTDERQLTQVLRDICAGRSIAVPELRPEILARYERRQLTGKLASVLDSIADIGSSEYRSGR